MTTTTSAVETGADSEPATAPLRFVTAASLFDGHDAAINVMRRLIQDRGAEVDPPRPQPQRRGRRARGDPGGRRRRSRSARTRAVTSSTSRYVIDMLREAGAGHIRVFGGGGGTITRGRGRRARGLRRRADLPPGRRPAARPDRHDRRPRGALAGCAAGRRACPTVLTHGDDLAIAQMLSALEDGASSTRPSIGAPAGGVGRARARACPSSASPARAAPARAR